MVAPKPKSTVEVPEIATKISEQVISAVKQYQQLTIDAAQGWAKVTSAFPVAEFPTIPGAPELPSSEALTTFAFDFTSELLNTQRAFALQLVTTLS